MVRQNAQKRQTEKRQDIRPNQEYTAVVHATDSLTGEMSCGKQYAPFRSDLQESAEI